MKVFKVHVYLEGDVDTLEEAKEKVQDKYKGRISSSGADRVDIVDSKGNVICNYSVG